ncbi:DUF3306 domain-containing protein [Azospirillum rugosum]|uniref:DUF3306 domain-containing protein n=1 Tax=Azospirillum rugosum TaxID=416170 RepID=A0ABS4SSL3_9PROT|nr:DUF3306 domain-containing protein [Azospirillum rugosum]MBP2295535.1 hypothetical protein [Azospirillum rugosum]MDQ0528414.1 hypothetical protein [Azospirillum rugosum]
MDESEGFLSRWSRLKRVAREESPPPLPAEEPEDNPVPAVSEAPADTAEPVFDPASLPPVESLGADSDYTAFLAPEVPQALRLQALRKAWVSDPVIANFRGFAEYDWDCNAPGYGALLPTDRILDMVDNVLGKDEPKEEAPPDGVPSPPWGEGKGEGVALVPDVPESRDPLTPALSPEGRGGEPLSDVPPTPSASRAAQLSSQPSVDKT